MQVIYSIEVFDINRQHAVCFMVRKNTLIKVWMPWKKNGERGNVSWGKKLISETEKKKLISLMKSINNYKMWNKCHKTKVHIKIQPNTLVNQSIHWINCSKKSYLDSEAVSVLGSARVWGWRDLDSRRWTECLPSHSGTDYCSKRSGGTGCLSGERKENRQIHF